GKVSTIVASQLPVEKWYGMIGEATFAEAILDRLIHRAVRVTLGRCEQVPDMRSCLSSGAMEQGSS
ncbi:ATP-binding protein, partial [Aeromonas media]|uniref:ATP-binding protein n=1 Tax=Aeromonas media TaxID=651 RepID=UPI0015D57884